MKKYIKHIIIAFISFLLIVILNFLLPRLLPGNPIGYLTGLNEEGMSAEKYAFYYHALHLDENILSQFRYYLIDIFNGTLGYSYKKEATISSLIFSKIGVSLQITFPAAFFSILIGILWGVESGYKKNGFFDNFSTILLLTLNTIPLFAIALILIILFCFNLNIFPYYGISSGNYSPGSIEFFFDRLYHLVLPILTIIIGSFPSKYLLLRNTTAQFVDNKCVLYAKQCGLSNSKIKFSYILKNISQPVIAMIGTTIGNCFVGSIIVENIFSINGVGGLLNDGINTLDYPIIQGILFVTTLFMVICVMISDILCLLVDPKLRKEKENEN